MLITSHRILAGRGSWKKPMTLAAAVLEPNLRRARTRIRRAGDSTRHVNWSTLKSLSSGVVHPGPRLGTHLAGSSRYGIKRL
jgi:hypothetical protein